MLILLTKTFPAHRDQCCDPHFRQGVALMGDVLKPQVHPELSGILLEELPDGAQIRRRRRWGDLLRRDG